jgi:hypothetical protein
MLTSEEFESLEVGDHISTTALFPALASEAITLRTAEKHPNSASFVVTYLGITVGRWQVTKNQGGLAWAFK